MSQENKLEFTGERFVPECQREIWYEHMHRYAALEPVVRNKRVLDAACGEGYGSHLLASWADHVTGVDISAEAIQHADQRYSENNLSFVESNVLSLPFADDSFDVVVSFETLEHLAEHEQLLQEFKRVLSPKGVLVISTPDKAEYSDKTGFENSFHVRELYRDEFRQLLDGFFPEQVWYGQKLGFFSTLWQLDQRPTPAVIATHAETGLKPGNTVPFPAMYYVVIASARPLQSDIAPLHLFSDEAESVYEHYNEMIREYISVAEKYVALNDRYTAWKKHPLWRHVLKWMEKS